MATFTRNMLIVCVILFQIYLTLTNEEEKLPDAHQSTLKKDNETEKNVTKHPKLEAYAENAHKRPTKCHVCRVLTQELWSEINKTEDVKQSYWLTNRLDGEEKLDEKRGKKIDYKTSEIRILEILENVCKNVMHYRSIAGPDFPYLKGVKSMFRQQLEEMMGESGLKLKLEAPEEMVEDPTFELRRMHYECNQMIEEHEDDIIEWYMHKQDQDPIEFICAERIVDAKEQDCLKASTEIPDYATKPSWKKEGEKLHEFTKGRKMEL